MTFDDIQAIEEHCYGHKWQHTDDGWINMHDTIMQRWDVSYPADKPDR